MYYEGQLQLDNFSEAVLLKLKSRYQNKIIEKQGLCVAIKSFKELDKIVIVGSGNVQVKVSKIINKLSGRGLNDSV
jgi:DNA-directed RNA polymerase subunit E'/Rpb7